jgi:starvation-inducible DNA-binding protein
MVEVVNQQVAALIDLRTHAKVAHWNVKGPQFAALHELFDEVADAVDEYADLVAERAAQLGGILRGTARQVAANSDLEEYSATGGS